MPGADTRSARAANGDAHAVPADCHPDGRTSRAAEDRDAHSDGGSSAASQLAHAVAADGDPRAPSPPGPPSPPSPPPPSGPISTVQAAVVGPSGPAASQPVHHVVLPVALPATGDQSQHAGPDTRALSIFALVALAVGSLIARRRASVGGE